MSDTTNQDNENNEEKKSWKPSRRQFLIGLGTLAVGAVVGAPTAVREVRLAATTAFLSGDAPTGSTPENPNIWFEIDADNTVHIYTPKIEMGQGIHTSLAQIAADELEVDWDNVVVHQPDTERGFDPGLIFTFGSTSITSLYQPIREIAATMREMVRAEAAEQLGVDVVSVSCEEGRCLAGDNSVTYGEVVSAKQGEWVIPEETPALKPSSDFRYIGQPVKRVDFYEKITGRAKYGFDARVPNMLYGAVAHPPRYGATLASASAGDAESLAGVVAVVIREGFAGIVAETRPQAYAALDALELTWEGGITLSQEELDEFITFDESSDGVLIQREGNVNSAFNSGSVIRSEYRTPLAAHAHLEPQSGLADVQDNSVLVYSATQAPDLTQNSVAEATGIDAENITVVPTYLGGGFGRKTDLSTSANAAILSQEVGRPVHIGWNRTEEMRYGYHRPPTHHILEATLNEDGLIDGIQHRLATGDVLFYTTSIFGGFGAVLPTILGSDPLAAFGAPFVYGIPNRRVFVQRRKMEIPTGFWRGLGTFPNTFAMESFLDELASASDIDPIEFRLRQLPDNEVGERMRVALERLAEVSDWDNLGGDGIGRGMAIAYDRNSVVALATTVSVEDGNIQPLDAWIVADAGFVVNPDGASAQLQGQIIMALSSALYEKLTIEEGMVADSNFNTYPLVTMRDAPSIDVTFINSGDTPIGGLGEPAIGLMPAALGNAIYNLTGQRLREMPFNLESTE